MSASEDDGDSPHGQGRSNRSRRTDELTVGESGSAVCETTWKPQSFQERVLAIAVGLVFAIGGIGSGKSEACALLLLMWALRHPRRADGTPTCWYVIGPEFSLIRLEQFPKILNHCRRLKELGYGTVVRRVVYGVDPKIILRDGQILLGRSGDQYRRMEGKEIDGFWLDEAQRQPEMAFKIAMTRMRNAPALRGAISASPPETPGWLWRVLNGKDRIYNRLRARMVKRGWGVWIFRWASRANATNNEGTLDVLGGLLDDAIAAQKLGGRFPGTPEAPSLGEVEYAQAFFGEINLSTQDAVPSTLGVDVGYTSDFAWFTVLSTRGVVLYMKRFNAMSPGYTTKGFYPRLEAEIQKTAALWRVKRTVIDTAKEGKPIFQNLEAKFPSLGLGECLGVDTGSGRGKKKAEIFESLFLGLAGGAYRIPERWKLPDGRAVDVAHVAELRREFESIHPVEHDERPRTWEHETADAKGHDDGIVSLALAASALPKGGPSHGGDYSGWKPPASTAPRFGGSKFGGRFSR